MYVKNPLGGGKPEGEFMMMPGVSVLLSDANPASVKAYINAVLKCGEC
ncbi:MAG: hypothetical protein QXP97_01480 [Desulfurococcus sp.]|uniref:Uncharacterized protein n=1 Tax=Desulfurococcus amylolyticus DSM 16532 TaxID=768672 RepID=I3XRW8_DESAM|nr:hypothetical protein [Desulfurococcus amylolyticus]AFL66692.1 hypothetical protein Desfe_0801 [Desulfurococcus amylolyticus DSM 16532]